MLRLPPATAAPLTTVDHVDLQRYVGKWYEIARYPNRFQRKCQSDTTATYTLREDGKVQVANACREKDGTMTTANGTAKVVDPKTNAKLKVTFFWPFYGDYWILGLGPDYQYAIVGEPDRKYLWILSRTPAMDEPRIRKFCAAWKVGIPTWQFDEDAASEVRMARLQDGRICRGALAGAK